MAEGAPLKGAVRLQYVCSLPGLLAALMSAALPHYTLFSATVCLPQGPSVKKPAEHGLKLLSHEQCIFLIFKLKTSTFLFSGSMCLRMCASMCSCMCACVCAMVNL